MNYSRQQAVFFIDSILCESKNSYSALTEGCRVQAEAIVDAATYNTVEHLYGNGEKLTVRPLKRSEHYYNEVRYEVILTKGIGGAWLYTYGAKPFFDNEKTQKRIDHLNKLLLLTNK